MAFRAVGALRPAVVIALSRVSIVTPCCCCRWKRVSAGMVSAPGSGSSKPHEQGECGQLKHVSSKCPTVKVEGVFSRSPRRFLCGNAGLHAIVLHCQRSLRAAPRRRAVLADRGSPGSPEWLAGQFFKDPAAEPGAQAGIGRLKGSSSSSASGRASRARSRLTRAAARRRAWPDRAGRSPPARRG